MQRIHLSLSSLPLACLVGLLSLAAERPLLAQTPTPIEQSGELKPGGRQVEKLPDGSKIIRSMDEAGQVSEQHIPPGEEADEAHGGPGGGPEVPPHIREMRERGRFASVYFQPLALHEPSRLAPGESGKIAIVVTLVGKAVVLPGSHISLKYKPVQGGLTLQGHRLEPAPLGELKTKFRGKRVYDNTMMFRVPVSIAGSAKHGRLPFQALVELQLHDGQTGQAIGREKATVEGSVLIGAPLPKIAVPIAPPPPPGGSKSGAGNPSSAASSSSTSAANGSAGAANTAKNGAETTTPATLRNGPSASGAGDPANNGTEDAGTDSEASDLAEESSFVGLPYLIGGAGVILLGLLVVLLRRR